MHADVSNQQPIEKIVGRRSSEPLGQPPSARSRAAWDALANYRTRVPKGVVIYATHDEMTRDRDRWAAEAVAQRTR
jgi:hypothetical protein